MKEGLIRAWNLHQEKNLLLLESMGETSLPVKLGPKDRTIGEQLAHMHDTRIKWTEFVARNLFDKNLLIDKNATLTIELLVQHFTESAKKIEDVIHASWDKDGKLPSFKAGLIPFVSYLISHESHHRGNILLTLKQSGIKLPDSLKWGLWEW